MRALTLTLALLPLGCMTEEKPEPPGLCAAEVKPVVAKKAAAKTQAADSCGAPASPSCCGGGCEGSHTGSAKGLVPSHLAKVGDRTKCLVSGGKFVVGPETVFVRHDGKRFPVCCAGCAKRFSQNPKKFLET